MKVYSFVLILFALSRVAFSQIVTPAWVDTVPGHHGSGYEIILGNDGYIYTAGSISLNMAYQKRIALIKLDKAGNRSWKYMSDTIPNSGLNGEAIAIASSNDGYLYIAGWKAFSSGATADIFLDKIDTAGNLIWERRYNGPFPQNNFDVANDVAVDDSGNVYITGTRNNINNFSEIVTIKYDSSGTVKWTKFDYVNNTSSHMYSNEIKVDRLGNVYVAGMEGFFTSPTAKTRALLISYDAAGNQRFRKTYNPVINYSSDARSLEVDENFNSYISGKSSDNSAYIIKYDSSGNQKWIYNYPGAYADDLELSESGSLYMIGCWWDTLHNNLCDMLLVKLDTSGSVLWSTTTGGNNHLWDYGLNLSTDVFDNVYLNGVYSDSLTINGMATLKYSPSGNLIWLGGFPENRCFGLGFELSSAVDDSGNVFITSSYCYQGSDENFFTLRYGALSTAITEFGEINNINLFPNPSNGNISVQFNLSHNSTVSIRIYDVFGREVKIASQPKYFIYGFNEIFFDTNSFVNGIYFFEIAYDNNRINRQFIVCR